MEQLQRGETPEPLTFGLGTELEYQGHITQASHLVPLPKRVFASSDKTHIRIWGAAGDITKTTFPANRRSMVSAMAFCPSFNALLTTEVDMTLKVYSVEKLDIIETFSLAQERKRAAVDGDNGLGSQKITALAYLPKNQWVLLGGDCGLELWKLSKSTHRRTVSVGRLEFHLSLELIRQVTSDAVLRIIANPAEQRIIVCGPEVLHILDMELVSLASRRKAHVGPVCSACLHVVSIIDTALLTGGADGAVNFWSIQGKQPMPNLALERSDGPSKEQQLPASMRLEHSFTGHTRPVEMVCFYHRLEHRVRQRLSISFARDGKMKVWSLEQFSVIYTLDSYIDSKADVFPLAPHSFAVSAVQNPNDSKDDSKDAGTTVMLMRFTAHVATPFATTNQSSVVQIVQPTHVSLLSPEAPPEPTPGLFGVAALVSEDMAIRVVDAEALRLISTLPPPPNSKVQVLRVFLCPVWRLLVLWLSSQEIAIFFTPEGEKPQVKQPKPSFKRCGTKGYEGSNAEKRSDEKSTTPVLIRRFSILEVRSPMFDKALSREAFHSMSLHHGQALPNRDALMSRGFEPNPSEGVAGIENGEFLLVGTMQGTLLAFHLGSMLANLNTWERLSAGLPAGAWEPPAGPAGAGRGAVTQTDARLLAIEEEHFEAMERLRVPGQRPYPRSGAPLVLHCRWKCHDYALVATESVGNSILTIDAKNNLRFWQTRHMQLLFHFQLGHYTCFVPFLQPALVDGAADASESRTKTTNKRTSVTFFESEPAVPSSRRQSDDAGKPPAQSHGELVLRGLAVGTGAGTVQLVVPRLVQGGEPTVLQSHVTHGDAVIQMDFGWPTNVFISVGKDNAVKIWSRRLVVLREIIFPQPLTTIAFRRRQDLDTSRGHGNVLLGFAAHVEQVSFDYWSRGIPEQQLGRDAEFTLEARQEAPAVAGSALLENNDNIDSHSFYLHVDSPPVEAPKRKKVITMSSVFKAGAFARELRTRTRDRKLSQLSLLEPKTPRSQGHEVADLRGGPCVPVGTLSGRAVDPDALDLASRPSQEPSVEHQRGDALDHGDFRGITRCDPGYYDWCVDPHSTVDAMRERAIRGTVSNGGQAVVTSLGIGHLRNIGKKKLLDASGNSGKLAPSPMASPRASLSKAADIAQSPMQDIPALGPGASSPRRRRSSEATESLTGSPQFGPSLTQLAQGAGLRRLRRMSTSASSAATATECPSEALTGHAGGHRRHSIWDEDESHESWRDKHVARGVPKEKRAKPRSQALANSEGDTAVMLRDRGHLAEAPEPEETNFLKALFRKKTEWTYCPTEHCEGKGPSQPVAEDDEVKSTAGSVIWTNAGRLVRAHGAPPRHAIPAASDMTPMQRINLRTPMTRSEVTELRLIEKAMSGPPPLPPDLTLESVERWERKRSPGKQQTASRGGSMSSSRTSICRASRSSGRGVDGSWAAPLTAR